MMKLVFFAIGLLLFVVVSPAVLAAKPPGVSAKYTVTDLTTRGESQSLAFGINSSGQVAGTSYDGTAEQLARAFLYSAGRVRLIGSLGGQSGAFGLNDRGDVVGWSGFDPLFGDFTAFLYRDGVMRDLGVREAIGRDINNQGQVLIADNAGIRAYLYTDLDGVTELSIPGDTKSVTAINNLGQIVGSHQSGPRVGNTSPPSVSFLRDPNGTITDLPWRDGPGPQTALGINDAGWVVGHAQAAPGPSHAFLYQDGQTIDLGIGEAKGINSFGDVVGGMLIEGRSVIFLYRDGVVEDLNTLIPRHSGWVLHDATAINDAGQIVGRGEYRGHCCHALLLTPTQTGAYYGLGDSVAAGHGLAGEAWACRRSSLAYPHAVARLLNRFGIGMAGHFACSGRQSVELINQIDEVVTDVGRRGIVEKNQKVIVSVTIGANDFPWAFDLGQLLAETGDVSARLPMIRFVCQPQLQFEQETSLTVNTVSRNIANAIQRLLDRVPNAKVVLTEYPNPVNPDVGNLLFTVPTLLAASCPLVGLPVVSPSTAWGRFELGSMAINKALDDIASGFGKDRVRVAQIHSHFRKHYGRTLSDPSSRLHCGPYPNDASQISWTQQPRDALQDSGDCFHPNATGALEIAKQVVKATAGWR